MQSHCFHSLLTGGGGLAGVDVADDDDVDMSLFFTVMIVDTSAMIIDIKSRLDSQGWRQAQADLDLLTPW